MIIILMHLTLCINTAFTILFNESDVSPDSNGIISRKQYEMSDIERNQTEIVVCASFVVKT